MAFDYQRAIRLFLVLGIVLRLLRYALCFPLWGDECMLAVNFLDRSWTDVAAPLEKGQVAPLGFVAIEMLAVGLLGFSEYSLRLAPLLASMAGLALFTKVARQSLSEQAAFFATAFLAVAHVPIRMATDAKPYAFDLLIAVVLVDGILRVCRETRTQNKRTVGLVLLSVVTPVSIWFSFPAAFVGGGAVLVLLLRGIRERSWRLAAAGIAIGLVLLASFATMVSISGQSQMQAHGNYMREYWGDFFPPALSQWAAWPAWLFRVHTNSTFAYPFGGEHGASLLTAGLAIVGLVVWFRKRSELAEYFALVLAIAFFAAWLRKYPYGVPRLSQYMAPFVCLSAAVGLEKVLDMARRWQKNAIDHPTFWPQRVGWLCAAVAVGIGVHTCVKPYGAQFDYEHRAFAKAFWRDLADKPVLSMIGEGDAGIVPHEDESFRCAQRLFRESPRPSPSGDDSLDIYCVIFESRHAAWNRTAYQNWWQSVTSRYDVVETKDHLTCAADKGAFDIYRVITLRPKIPDGDPPKDQIAEQPETSLRR
jgi:hypothetical protein